MLGYIIDITIAHTPIDMADGNAIKIAAKDLTNFLGGITMRDLGGLAFNESAHDRPVEPCRLQMSRGCGCC